MRQSLSFQNGANQISVEMKQDLEKKLQEFASYNDNLEEVFETVSRSRFHATMRNFRNQRWSPLKSMRMARFITRILLKRRITSKKEIFLNIGKADPQMSRPFHLNELITMLQEYKLFTC